MKTPQQKPRIAIPIPTSANDEYNQRCWPQYAAAVEAVGGDAIRIPLGQMPAETATLVTGCSAILLPGSPADVNPQKYGQRAHSDTKVSDPGREATDELLLQDAFHLRKPLLGVCFGLQMMNVWRGGTLVQHLADGHTPATDQNTMEHTITVEPEGQLLRSFFLDNARPTINSSHHQAIDQPGDGLVVAARSTGDRVIEALEGSAPNEQFVLGVQWHPERSYTSDQPSIAIFTSFVAAAHRWRLPQA